MEIGGRAEMTCRHCGKGIESWKQGTCSKCLLEDILLRNSGLLGQLLSEDKGGDDFERENDA